MGKKVGIDELKGRDNGVLNVAAIVPVYNVEEYLPACLESLLNQSYPYCEIVLIDDGSTDESGAICEEYAERSACIKVVHKSNEGLGYARNTGLGLVSESVDYVMFIDSDDWVDRDYVKKFIDRAGGESVDCVIAGYTKMRSNGDCGGITKIEDASWSGDEIRRHLIPRVCGSKPRECDAIPMSVCSCLLNYRLILDNALSFPSEREVISEDFAFKVQFLSVCQRVETMSYCGYLYRDNPSSLSTSYRPDRFDASLSFHEYANRLVGRFCSEKDYAMRLRKTLFINVRSSLSQERVLVSGKSLHAARAAISSMLSDKRLIKEIESYPVHDLGLSQRVFLGLIKHRMVLLMQLAIQMGML